MYRTRSLQQSEIDTGETVFVVLFSKRKNDIKLAQEFRRLSRFKVKIFTSNNLACEKF